MSQQSTAVDQEAADRRLRRRIFWIALGVRVAYILLAHTYRFRSFPDHFYFGFEMGRVGRSLAEGTGYADTFGRHYGPTAWSPPLYTLLIGAVFRVFGIYSPLSAIVLESLNSAFSAITAVAAFEIGQRCFSRRIGLWTGWLWALHPAAMQYAVRWIWEMTLTTALFTWLLVLTLRLAGTGESGVQPRQSWQRWCWFGVGWGALALSNPSTLPMLPVMALYALLAPGWRGHLAVRLPRVVAAAVLTCVVITPWAVRNWVVFHRFIPLRDNFGAENYMGNADWSLGFPWGQTVPLADPIIRREYISMGEAAWAEDRGHKAKLWIATHRKRYVQLTVKRTYMYWAAVPKSVEDSPFEEYSRLIHFQFLSLCGLFGLALVVWRRSPGWQLFAATMLLLPAPYYLVTVQSRFRHVLEPIIFLLGTVLFASAEPGRFGRGIAGAVRASAAGRIFARLAPWFRGEMPAQPHVDLVPESRYP